MIVVTASQEGLRFGPSWWHGVGPRIWAIS